MRWKPSWEQDTQQAARVPWVTLSFLCFWLDVKWLSTLSSYLDLLQWWTVTVNCKSNTPSFSEADWRTAFHYSRQAIAFYLFCSALCKSDQMVGTEGECSHLGLLSVLFLFAHPPVDWLCVNVLLWRELIQSPVLFHWLKGFLRMELVVFKWN